MNKLGEGLHGAYVQNFQRIEEVYNQQLSQKEAEIEDLKKYILILRMELNSKEKEIFNTTNEDIK